MTVLIYGWMALDTIETPGGRIEGALGGSAPAAALAAALFAPTRLLGVVGEDFPREYIDLFGARGIDIAGLWTMPGAATSTWGCRYDATLGERETTFRVAGPTEGHVPGMPGGWESSTTVLLGACDPAAQGQVLGACPGAVWSVVDTIEPYASWYTGEVREVMSCCDVATLGEGEAATVGAGAPPGSLAREGVVVKHGGRGSTLHTPGADTHEIRPCSAEAIVDPTGAGDAFAGALAGYLDSRREGDRVAALREGLAYASVVASFQVEGMGTGRLAGLGRDEVESRYAGYRNLAQERAP